MSTCTTGILILLKGEAAAVLGKLPPLLRDRDIL